MSYHQKGVCYICREYSKLYGVMGPPVLCPDCMNDARAMGPPTTDVKRESAFPAHPNSLSAADSQRMFKFDQKYEEQERRRALDARMEGWSF